MSEPTHYLPTTFEGCKVLHPLCSRKPRPYDIAFSERTGDVYVLMSDGWRGYSCGTCDKCGDPALMCLLQALCE